MITTLKNTESIKNSQRPIVVTHPGVFHGDEVFTIALVALINPNLSILRTADPKAIEAADIVIDIGGEHNPDTYRFDHHQMKPEGDEVPPSSMGLMWAYPTWVDKVCRACCPDMGDISITEVQDRVYKSLIQGIDAQDNGWAPKLGGDVTQDGYAWYMDGTWVGPGKGMSLPPNRPGEPYSVSRAVSAFNPTWDSKASRESRFRDAVYFASGILRAEIRRTIAVLKARQKVLNAHTDPSGRILILEEYVPWQEHLFARTDSAELLYVVFPSLRGGWQVQQVPEAPGSFKGRLPLPEKWAGKRGLDLAAVTGLDLGDDSPVFCHPGRFIAGTSNREDTLMLAKLALAIGG